MNDKMLNGIKNEYQEIKKAIDSDFKELSELEDNPVVQRYNHLRNLQMLAASGEFKDNRGILRYCLTKTGTIEETNNIYVYMFENTIKRLEKTFGMPILESEKDKSKVAIYYVDLENASKYVFVPKDQQEDFEKTNKVVYGKEDIYDSSDRYHNLRRQFFDLCMQHDQEQAVQSVLEDYKRKA